MTRMDQIMSLPIHIRRMFVDAFKVMPLFCPHDERYAARVKRDVKPLTKEDVEEFRRYFPDGLFGRIEPNPKDANHP